MRGISPLSPFEAHVRTTTPCQPPSQESACRNIANDCVLPSCERCWQDGDDEMIVKRRHQQNLSRDPEAIRTDQKQLTPRRCPTLLSLRADVPRTSRTLISLGASLSLVEAVSHGGSPLSLVGCFTLAIAIVRMGQHCRPVDRAGAITVQRHAQHSLKHAQV